MSLLPATARAAPVPAAAQPGLAEPGFAEPERAPERAVAGGLPPGLAPAAVGPAALLAGRQVTIVEDDATTATLLRALCRRLGAATVHVFNDGARLVDSLGALRRSSLGARPILLLDLQMPQIDGLQLLRAIAASGFRPDILPMSVAEPRLLEAARALGAQHGLAMGKVLAKPVNEARLVAACAAPGPDGVLYEQVADAVAQPSAEALRAACAAGAFVPWYQPKLTLTDGQVHGAEVLARWLRDGSLLSPGRFIPGIEEAGLATDLMLSLLRRAITEAAATAPGLGLAINVSMQSLQRLDLPDIFAAIMRETGTDPARITLEVTESAVVGDLAAVLETTTRLRLHGFGLSIDDFGTGYSSLLQLRRLPFSELKIDRSFVRNAHSDPDTRAILETTVELARRLQLSTVAEGVETQLELEFVRSLGVDAAQGYAISAPVPATALAAAVRAGVGLPPG